MLYPYVAGVLTDCNRARLMYIEGIFLVLGQGEKGKQGVRHD